MEEEEFDYTGIPPGGAPRLVHDGTRIARYASTVPDSFAGQWIENETERFVAFTDDLDKHRAAIRPLVFHPDRVHVIAARHTYDELLIVTEEVEEIVGVDGGLTSWEPDAINNCVYVGVVPDQLDRVRRLLTERYGVWCE